MEVHTTSDFAYGGEIYNTIQDFKTPKDCLSFTANYKKQAKKIKTNLYDINTNTYKNLTTNKKVEIVKYYNELEDYVLRKDSKIIRNYLKKGVTFKYNKRIMEVNIKENKLLITFIADVKMYDTEDRLFIRKGYEKQNLCYSINVSDDDSFNYALLMFNKVYEIITNPFEKEKVHLLLKELTNRIKNIDRSIKVKKLNKGTMFTASRNFTILEKRRYGIHIRLLPVEDKDNILSVVGRTNFEPLCRFYNLKEVEDIDTIMPFIEESFNMTKYPAMDLKHGLKQFYVEKGTKK